MKESENMDREVVAKKDGKAFRTNVVDVEDGYVVDDDYDLVLLENEERSSTGLLKVFELRAKRPGLNNFEGRWDERPGGLGALDVDMVDVDGKRLKHGFDGHHTSSEPDDQRRLRVQIRVPSAGRLVFSGTVAFGLGREIALGESARATVGVTSQLIRDGKIVPE